MDTPYPALQTAPFGSLVTLEEKIQMQINPLDYFSRLSQYGRLPHSLLFESAAIIHPYGERSVGIVDPCLKVSGRGSSFMLTALNEVGNRLLNRVLPQLTYCQDVRVSGNRAEGFLVPDRKIVSETERLRLRTHIDILRTIAFSCPPLAYHDGPYGGLFGSFSYDFIDQFEDLPPSKTDLTHDPDYEFYFADSLFQYDHNRSTLSLIVNALILDENRDHLARECQARFERYRCALNSPAPLPRSFSPYKLSLKSDLSEKEYCDRVHRLKEHINRGDVFQAVLSRALIADYHAEPLETFSSLRKLNPSPYMFFINYGDHILLGASPERCISVSGEHKHTRRVEIHPIAGTKPRGHVEGHLDVDLDNRYETELRLDPKELAEHTMLVDLARNDIARISKPGTRRVEEPYRVVHYSNVHHLVSKVTGTLKEEYDALHAYLASMNMGTLTGAPKVEAMRLLRTYEASKRGLYGGAVAYLTPSGTMDSAIVIRSMNIKQDTVYLRAGAGIVYDSIPKNEYEETERKLAPCLKALKLTGGYV